MEERTVTEGRVTLLTMKGVLAGTKAESGR